MRRVASSRVRCAIVIDSELAITNEPTKSAMPPNASRKLCRKEMDSSVSSASACACCAAGPHLRPRRKDLLDLRDELRLGDVRLRGDGDLVEPALLPHQPLRSRQVESGEGRAADREPGAEVHDPGDPEALDRALRLDTDRLPDREVLLVRRFLVDDDLVRPRPRALDERQRVEPRIGVRDREAEIGRAAEHDRLPVVADQLRRVGVDARPRPPRRSGGAEPSRAETRRTSAR